MKSLPKKKLIIAVLIVLLSFNTATDVAILLHYHHTHTTKSVVTVTKKTKTTTKPTATKPVTVPTYKVGDTQTAGQLSITLNSTGGGTTMGELPQGYSVFSINLTVTNNGSTPYLSPDAFNGVSFVYTQQGSDTSTGKYIPAFNTPCFGGGDVAVPPNQSVSGCVEFQVPTNATIDTYFYQNLKWYL